MTDPSITNQGSRSKTSVKKLPKDGYFSPLRYPGGKAKLTGYILEILKLNYLQQTNYIEPFCGGAGIGISLLANGHISHLHLNDFDRAIYAFWHSVKFQNEEFCQLVTNTSIDIYNWKKQKDIIINKSNADLLELGYATFFLNRTNRSGILSGGVIGGKEQKGTWKLNARFNKTSLIERIELIGALAKNITVTNFEVRQYIDKQLPKLPLKSFVYFDPPYYHKGASLYMNAFKPNDHHALSEDIKNKVKHPWIVTYDNTKEISDMYKRHHQTEFSLNYSAQNHYKGSELMIFKHGLNKPKSVFKTRKCPNITNNEVQVSNG